MTALQPGQTFPKIDIAKLGGGTLSLTETTANHDWKMIVVYRGKHCPLCTRYLNELNQLLPELNDLGVDVVAVSADSAERAEAQLAEINPNYPIGYGLTIEQMNTLGLYISEPRLGMDAVAPFAEPGLFVVNEMGQLQMIDISNVPFFRPNLQSTVMGIKYVRGQTEKYPINGTYQK